MKKFIQLSLLLITTASFSQINFEPGYFISNNGTKTQCLIKNMAWKNNPESFEYKLNESSEPQTAFLINVEEFSVDNAYKFTRFTVDIDRSIDYVEKLTSVREANYVKDTLFLKTLVSGKATLYEYREPGIEKYFYSTGSHTQPIQLFYKRYVELGIIKQDNNYRQQLFLLMKDKMPQPSRYERVKYKKSPLVKLFLEYNGSEGKNMEAKQNQASINLKVTAGAGLGSLSINNNRNVDHDFKKGTIYMAGAELEYILPFNNNKWSVFLNPNVQFYESTSSDDVHEYEAKYSFFQVAVGGRHYIFLNDKAKIFIDAAYSLAFNMDDSYIKYSNKQLDFTKVPSLSAGAGLNYGPYSAALRYTFAHKVTDYVYWDIDYGSAVIILSYNFL